jgi:hypothetical protein
MVFCYAVAYSHRASTLTLPLLSVNRRAFPLESSKDQPASVDDRLLAAGSQGEKRVHAFRSEWLRLKNRVQGLQDGLRRSSGRVFSKEVHFNRKFCAVPTNRAWWAFRAWTLLFTLTFRCK